jgi:hypothetical protein
MKKSEKYNLLKRGVIFVNIAYILWILYNGIDEGFRGSIVSVVAPFGLVLLLIINIILLSRFRKI